MLLTGLLMAVAFGLSFGAPAESEEPVNCFPKRWLSMEEILYLSDVVVWGKDTVHAKLRHPNALDSRFEVYCVLKGENYQIPRELIIEDIDTKHPCSAVTFQTEVGQEYIIGLTLMTSGFMTYANINKMQKSAFAPSPANFDRLMKSCELANWRPPEKSLEDICPVVPANLTCDSMTTTPPPPSNDRSSFFDMLFGLSDSNGGNEAVPVSIAMTGAGISVFYVIEIALNYY